MEQQLIVSPSPHLTAKTSTTRIMGDVIIALVPTLIASVVLFGPRAFLVVAVAVLTCVIAEYLCCKVLEKNQSIGDLSAVVTGILLAFNLPVTIPLWQVIFGSMAAIIVVKQMFGGIGCNFVNPALIGRIVLLGSFPETMNSWVTPFDAVTTATPLAIMAENGQMPMGYSDLFWGLHGGCLGETCIFTLLLGGIYLLIRRVISPAIPLIYLGTVAVLSLILGHDPIFQLLSGGLILGAIFMATDYTTSPITPKGRMIFACGCGILTVLIRFYGSLPEGVSFSIVIMNILVPLIEKITTPIPFGMTRRAK